MYTDILSYEEKHKRISRNITIGIGIFLIAILFLNIFSHPDPPLPKQGVLVSFGEPDKGKGNSTPDTQQEEPVEETGPEETSPPEEVQETEESTPEESAPPEETSPPEATEPTEKEVVTSDDPDEIAIKKAKEEAKKKAEAEAKKKAEAEAKKKAEAEAKKKAEAEAKKKAEEEAKKKAEEEARKKAEAEAKKKAELEAKKKQYGDLFGDGKGETDTEGNQGDPDGDPDGKALEGISTGSGTVGGGLADRGLVSAPTVEDNTQKTGKVVLKVCVGSNGKVIPSSVKFTQSGSTTTDAHLIDLAKRNALKFEFSEGQMDKQCGTISFDFKVK